MSAARFKAACDALKASGMTQADIANALGIAGGQQYISAICRGVKTPSEQLTRHVELLAGATG